MSIELLEAIPMFGYLEGSRVILCGCGGFCQSEDWLSLLRICADENCVAKAQDHNCWEPPPAKDDDDWDDDHEGCPYQSGAYALVDMGQCPICGGPIRDLHRDEVLDFPCPSCGERGLYEVFDAYDCTNKHCTQAYLTGQPHLSLSHAFHCGSGTIGGQQAFRFRHEFGRLIEATSVPARRDRTLLVNILGQGRCKAP